MQRTTKKHKSREVRHTSTSRQFTSSKQIVRRKIPSTKETLRLIPNEPRSLLIDHNRFPGTRIAEKRATINLKRCMYKVVEDIALEYGMTVVRDDATPWDVYWSDVSLTTLLANRMDVFQRINHIPGVANLESKSFLAHHLNRLRNHFVEEYDFFPRSWSLPWQYDDMMAYVRQHPAQTFIMKPTRGAEGKGIKLFSTEEEAKKLNFGDCVVQLYVPNLLLMDGFKFDLRVYVIVTSIDPLRIFVYNNGLVRLATFPYAHPHSSNIKNQYMHLTNYSINKSSDKYNESPEDGSKRDFVAFNAWLANQGLDGIKLWARIDDIIIKTIVCVYPILKDRYEKMFPEQYHHSVSACFEMLGMDILVDQNMKPYLLEVNRSPSFNIAGVVDERVKKHLLHDTFGLLNLNDYRRGAWTQDTNPTDRNDTKNKSQDRSKKTYKLVHDNKESSLTIKDQVKWETRNTGNFRLIYPTKDSYNYSKFIHHIFSLSEFSKKKM